MFTHRFAIWSLLLLASSFAAFGQGSAPSIIGQDTLQRPIITAVPFLTIAPDARSAGMGDAGVATSPDANSIHWNPAKLAFIDKGMGFSLSFTPWLQRIVGDMSLSYLSGYYKVSRRETVAASMRYFDLGSMEFTDIRGNIITEFNPREFSFDLAYALQLSDRFSIGGTGRFIHSNLSGNISSASSATADTRPGNTAAVDLSLFYKNDDIVIGNMLGSFALGANISNIGFKISYTDENQRDFIPTNFRLGSALTAEVDAANKFTLALDFNKLMVPTPDGSGQVPNVSLFSGMLGSFSDAPGGFSEELREFMISTGVEYWYNDLFAIRGGYYHESAVKGNRQYATLGLGLRYQKFGIDFAYLVARQRQHPLEDTLRFTLLINFDKQEAPDNVGG